MVETEEKEPNSNEVVANAYTTSTLELAIATTTGQYRGSSKVYNPDVIPYQSWILKLASVDIRDRVFREKLLEASQFLRKHTYDRLWEIIANGWYYTESIDKKEEAEKSVKKAKFEDTGDEEEDDFMSDVEWDEDLEDAFIDATSKGMVIDTAMITRWADGSYKVFTANDVRVPTYGNDYRKITEIYFNYPIFDNFINEDTGKPYSSSAVGFLTQHSEDTTRKNRMGGTETIRKEKIFRDCVIVQPKSYVHDKFGISYLLIECETATQKIYLRSYEFAYLHKGGVNRVIAFPEGSSKNDIKDTIVRETQRGIWSRGYVLSHNSARPVNELFLTSETQIPSLGFNEINSMISEDAQLTKQGVEGAAETGALGGQAPQVNKEQDEKQLDSLLYICERIIRDINFVFFDKDPWKFKDIGHGRKKREPAYRVVFREPAPEQPTPGEERDAGIQDQEMANNTRSSYDEQISGMEAERKKRQGGTVAHSYKYEKGEDLEALAHSINDEFVTFQGNMFHAGIYLYPEKGRYETFTKKDIKTLTERNVKDGYLEIDHSFNYQNVGLLEGIGHYNITGYNDKLGEDITEFHVKKNIYDDLKKKGLIKLNKKGKEFLKFSPFFHRRNINGVKQIFLKNVAIVTKGKPRAELSGHTTNAQKL